MAVDNEFVLVLQAIEDHVFETHTVCDIAVVVGLTGLSREKCRKILQILERQNRVCRIFKGPGKPDLYLPYHMWQGVLITQRKPEWLDKYALKEKQILLKAMKSQEEKLHELEAFERLLYATDIPLERAVAKGLLYLKYKDVVHHEDEKGREDISFSHDGITYLVEVKGKGGQGDKDDIEQLNGWITQALERDQIDPDEIRGIFVLNHYRHQDPSAREDPLTSHAKKWLKYYRFTYLTTPFFHNALRSVMANKASKKDVRRRLLKGESY